MYFEKNTQKIRKLLIKIKKLIFSGNEKKKFYCKTVYQFYQKMLILGHTFFVKKNFWPSLVFVQKVYYCSDIKDN